MNVLLIFLSVFAIDYTYAADESNQTTDQSRPTIRNGNDVKLLGGNLAVSLNLDAIDKIFDKIKNKECTRDLGIWVDSLINGRNWALKMFDSLPKFPSGLLDGNLYVFGNFDECVEINTEFSFVGQYCLAEVHFNHTYRINDDVLQHNRMRFNTSIVRWGFCVPSSCNKTDAAVLAHEIFSLVDTFGAINVKIDDKNCYTIQRTEITTGELIYAVTVGVVVIFSLVSTVSHCCLVSGRKRRAVYNVDTARNEISTVRRVILCFSLVKVVGDLLRAKPNELNLECICGIKFLSMMLIVAGHSLIFIFGGPIANTGFVGRVYTDPVNGILTNPLLVDTFLLVSGFLMCRLLLAELDKRNGRINVLGLYIARYIRLTPAYLVTLGFYLTWMPKVADGPLWRSTIGTEADRCRQSWWTNLLYVNNYVRTDSLCMFQAWYLAADYHLFILAPGVVYPLWRWRRVGKLLLALCVLGFTSLSFYLTYVDDLDPTLLAFPPEIQDLSTNRYFRTAYIKTHMRASSYCFGLLFGYVVHKIQSAETKIPPSVMWTGSVFSAAITSASMLSIVTFFDPSYVHDALESATYAAFHRVGWCLGIGWVILVCVTENADGIDKFLSWKPFVPLSRLTYCAYLVNGFVAIYNKGVLRQPSYLSKYELSCTILGHFVVTFSVAFLLCVFFESPVHGLEKIFLRRGERPASQHRTEQM